MALEALIPSALWLANAAKIDVTHFVAVQFEDFNKVTSLVSQKASNIVTQLGVSVISFTEFVCAHEIIYFLNAFWPNVHGDAAECFEAKHLAAGQQSVMTHDNMASILQQIMSCSNVIAAP